MSSSLLTISYLIAGVLFILSLGGLTCTSHRTPRGFVWHSRYCAGDHRDAAERCDRLGAADRAARYWLCYWSLCRPVEWK